MAHHDEKSRNTRSASSSYLGQKYNPYQGRDLIKEDLTKEDSVKEDSIKKDSTQTPQKNRTNQSNQMNNHGYTPSYPPHSRPSLLTQKKKSNANGTGATGFALELLALVVAWTATFSIKESSLDTVTKVEVTGGIITLCVVFWIAGMVLSVIGCFKEPRVLAAIGIGLAILNYICLPDLTAVKAFWNYYMPFNNLLNY